MEDARCGYRGRDSREQTAHGSRKARGHASLSVIWNWIQKRAGAPSRSTGGLRPANRMDAWSPLRRGPIEAGDRKREADELIRPSAKRPKQGRGSAHDSEQRKMAIRGVCLSKGRSDGEGGTASRGGSGSSPGREAAKGRVQQGTVVSVEGRMGLFGAPIGSFHGCRGIWGGSLRNLEGVQLAGPGCESGTPRRDLCRARTQRSRPSLGGDPPRPSQTPGLPLKGVPENSPHQTNKTGSILAE